jgi:signal transduction histidine kinase
MFKKYHYPQLLVLLKKYSIHIFGIIAFLSIFSLGAIAFVKQMHTGNGSLATYIPYGILLFILNVFYIKVIRLSREDYENKLKKEKEYSQKILKSQKRFLRYAVHETNTPLAVIMANIELFELEHGKNILISNIEAATKNMYGIYDDLSYLAKKDKLIYSQQKIILADFIQSRIEFFDIVAQQLKLSFTFQNICIDSEIYINETKLQRIVDNNITNALKYTKEHQFITISLYSKNDHCIFDISSTSTIKNEPQHIFDAYYRENTLKEGLGLGLRLVKNICDEENIEIVLESTEDKTSFTYYIPKGSHENFIT